MEKKGVLPIGLFLITGMCFILLIFAIVFWIKIAVAVVELSMFLTTL